MTLTRFYIILLTSIILLSGGCARQLKVSDSLLSSSTTQVDSPAKEIALDHYTSGAILEEANDLHKAAVEYNLARLFDPASVEISMALARVYNMLGEWQAALIVLEQARRFSPENIGLLKMLAELYMRNGNFMAGLKYYSILENISALSFEETMAYTVMLERLGRAEEALKVCKRCFTRFGPSSELYERIGWIHVSRYEFEAADTAFKKLVEIDPENHRFHFLLGGFSVARQDWKSAQNYFERALEIAPDETRYWSNLILVLQESKQIDDALMLVNTAIKQFPDNPEFLDTKGRIFEQLKRYDDALECFDSSIALDSNRVAPYAAKGYVYHNLKRWDESVMCYEIALSIEPDNPVTLNNYAYMLSVRNSRLDEALQMVEKALEMQPATSSFRDTRGWILYRMGRYNEAHDEIKAAMEEDIDNAELYEHLGHVYKALGRDADAKSAWRKAAELEPDNIEYQELAE